MLSIAYLLVNKSTFRFHFYLPSSFLNLPTINFIIINVLLILDLLKLTKTYQGDNNVLIAKN